MRIDPEPLATASIAQIHRALLKDGRDVVVKVRRPGRRWSRSRSTSQLMRSTVSFLHEHSETAQLLQLEALADELETHLRGELDFVEEANNTELIAGLVEESPELVVPRVMRPYVTERVLVLERIEGEKVAEEHGLEPEQASELARAFFRAYVRQVTIEGVYHADPHRGNILITPDGRLALLDFGLLGRLDDDTRRGAGAAAARDRAEPRRRRRRPDPRALADDDPLRPAGVRARDPAQAAALPLAAARRASAPARRSPTCSGSRFATGSGCRRASRSSARRSRRRTRSRARSTRSSTRSR